MPIPHGNAVLRLLPSEELRRLEPYLRTVALSEGQRIVTPDEPLTHIWFVEDGAVSRLVHLLTGESVEAGIIGTDGVVGLPLVLGGESASGACTVQVRGSATVMSSADFCEHVREPGGPLLSALLLYANLYVSVLSQLTACHCIHRIEQRLSRCLLTLSDHVGNGHVRVTHDTLADFLGVHRPSITYALQALVSTGVIASERRRIVVVDRAALLTHACECYAVIRNASARELERIRLALR